MRGVVSSGMAAAIQHLGLLDCFDVVYGSSAGAVNAAYLTAGQAWIGTSLYYQDLNNSRFISFRRALLGGPLVDVDFLAGPVMTRQKPLDVAAVLAARIPLCATATDADTGQTVVFTDFRSGEQLRSALRASTTMPAVSGGAFRRGGRQFFDASLLSEPIPLASAETATCTHMVSLLTRPAGAVRSRAGLFDWYMRRWFVRHCPALSPLSARRHLVYAESIAAIRAGRGPTRGTPILAIVPGGPLVNQLERRAGHLVRGACDGFRAVASAFGEGTSPGSVIVPSELSPALLRSPSAE